MIDGEEYNCVSTLAINSNHNYCLCNPLSIISELTEDIVKYIMEKSTCLCISLATSRKSIRLVTFEKVSDINILQYFSIIKVA